ncbi:MAG: DNA-binding protein [Acidobacteria bacterium]|nr:DNA-binding protein [Acidobacteriota bacterium]
MKALVALAFALTFLSVAPAQKTRREVVKATTPEQDAKPNDPNVPDGVAISTQFERVVIFRFKHKADLLAGMQQLVEQEGIRNAVILAGAGSVRNYQIHSVSNRDFPSKNIYIEDKSEPADIISMNGYVLDGRLHPHLTLTTGEKAFGGHLEPGTNVFTFAIITLGVLKDDVDLSRLDDKTWR